MSEMKIKIVFGQDIRRWRYPDSSRFESLVKFSEETFNLSANDKFYFQFHDDEGDRMTLSSESDLNDALVTAEEDGRKSLKIFLINGSIENARQQQSDIFKSGIIAPSVASIASTDDFDVLSNVSRVESYSPTLQEARSSSPEDNESKIQHDDNKNTRQNVPPNQNLCGNLLNLLQNEATQDLLPDFVREVLRVLLSDVNEGIEVAAMRVLTMDEFAVINEHFKLADIFSLFNNVFQDSNGGYANNDNSGGEVHVNVACDMCGVSPIVGTRYKCCLCRNFDMCSVCERQNTHDKTHPLLKFSTPTDGFMWGTLPGLKEMFEKNCWFRNRFSNGNGRFGWGRGRRRNGHGPHGTHGQHGHGHHAHTHGNGNNGNGNDFNKRGWGNWNSPMHPPHMNFAQHFNGAPAPPPHHMPPPPGHPFHGWGHFGWGETDSSNRTNCNQSRGGINNCNVSSSSSTVNSNSVNKSNKLKADFVCNVNMPDRERYPSDTILEKSWKMRNSGAIEWGNNCELVFVKGNEKLSLQERYQVVNAQPGEEVIISAMIKTPKEPGRYCSYYRLECNEVKFGPRVWVDVFVDDDNSLSQSTDQNNKKLKKKQIKKAKRAEKLQRKREKLTRKLEVADSRLDQIPQTEPGSDDNDEQSVRMAKKLQKRRERLVRKLERTDERIKKNAILPENETNRFEVAENSVSISSSTELSIEPSAPILNSTLPPVTVATESLDEGLTIRCMCGDPMILIDQSQAYVNSTGNVHCDICGKNCGSEMVYHCTRGKSMVHNEGYDLCTGCVELQKKSFRPEPNIVSTIDDNINNNNNNININNNNDSVTPNNTQTVSTFAYPNQLEQLLSMGFANDVETLKQLLMEHNGNLETVLQHLFSS